MLFRSQYACASAASFEVREKTRYYLNGQEEPIDAAAERSSFEECMTRKGFKRRG